jgi:hypothetical protein
MDKKKLVPEKMNPEQLEMKKNRQVTQVSPRAEHKAKSQGIGTCRR